MTFNYTITTDFTDTKVKADLKGKLTEKFLEFLAQEFGESVGMIRTGSGDSKKNEIGVVAGSALTTNGEVPITAAINISIKEFIGKAPTKNGRDRSAFNFEDARQAYEDYLDEKAESSAAKEKAKAEKIAKDTAARKAKAEKTENAE